MSCADLPDELLSHVFSFLPILDKVSCRLVSQRFKALAEASLAQVKVVYAAHTETVSSFRLEFFLSEGAKIKFAQTSGNYLKLRRSVNPSGSFELPILREGILEFLATYCTSIEGFVAFACVPFPRLAGTIGPRLTFFKVLSGKCQMWPYSMEDVKKMVNLRFFSGEYLPCPWEFLRSSIRLLAVSLICYNGCPVCCDGFRQKNLAADLPSDLIYLDWRSEGQFGALVNPSFGNSLRHLRLIMYNEKLSFSFPNLISSSVTGAADNWDELLESLKHSHNLRTIHFSVIRNMNQFMDKLWPVLRNFPNLEDLDLTPLRYALDEPIDLTDEMIHRMALYLPALKTFHTKTNLYQEQQLAKLRQRISGLNVTG